MAINNIKEKIQEKLSTLTDKQIYWLFAGVLLGIFLLDFLLLMQPQLNALSKINPKIKLIKTDIQNAKNDIARIDHYRSEVERYQEKLEKLNSNILHRQEIPLILETISRIANKHNLIIEQIMPDVINQELLLEEGDRRYYAMPINIDGKCAYHNFGRFVDAIENEEIYLSVDSFKISSKANTKQHALSLVLYAVVYEGV